jgi:tetratricopeptide (TPR) repeat protein
LKARLLLALLLPLVSPVAARADAIDQAWKRGNDATFRGDYDTALAAYVELDRQGIVSADLFYNLGVAYYRKGDLGRAIWSFERAVALDPEAEDARFNLAQARKLATRRAADKLEGAEREPLWIRTVTALTTSTQTWVFLVLYLGCFGLLFLRRRAAEDHRVPLGVAAALLGVGAAVMGLMLFGRATLDRLPFGIVLPEQVAVKEGADPNYRTSFDVHAGLKVRLFDREHDWVRVRLANGLEGWVREDAVGRL